MTPPSLMRLLRRRRKPPEQPSYVAGAGCTRSVAAALLFAVPAYAAEVVQSEIDVIDGGTIRVHGETIHIVGIDAPKLGQAAHCGVERMLAARATSRLRPIIRSGERI